MLATVEGRTEKAFGKVHALIDSSASGYTTVLRGRHSNGIILASGDHPEDDGLLVDLPGFYPAVYPLSRRAKTRTASLGPNTWLIRLEP
jgi:hypothetical protein